MNSSDKRRLTGCLAILAMAVIVATPAAFANVARVEFSIGDVTGIASDGKERKLAKGSVLEAGDTVRTQRGRVQIRFTDGGYTSLQPNTVFRIDDYYYDEKKTDESVGFFSLLKGGLRTITGVIGKIRKKAYQLTTPVATVGIRGTEYLAELGNSLTVHVGEGEIEVCSNAGCTPFGAHQTGYVASADSRAVLAEHPPSLAPPQERQVYAYNGNYQAQFDEGANYSSTSQQPPLPNGPHYALAVSWGQSSSNADLFESGLFSPPDSLTDATFDGNAGLAEYFNSFGTSPVSGSVGSAQIVEIGYAGPVGWGRWTQGGADVGSGGGPGKVPVWQRGRPYPTGYV